MKKPAFVSRVILLLRYGRLAISATSSLSRLDVRLYFSDLIRTWPLLNVLPSLEYLCELACLLQLTEGSIDVPQCRTM